tara:strand:- start:193 stop:372 length:180 start_codon:yes stop_codon:yes gene_type:complete
MHLINRFNMFTKIIQKIQNSQQRKQEAKSISEIRTAFRTKKLSSLAERRKAIIYLRKHR